MKNRLIYWLDRLIIVYFFSLVCLYIPFLFNNNLTADSAYSMITARSDFWAAFSDIGHPPLYYLLLKLCVWNTAYDYVWGHLLSVIPLIIIAILSYKKIRIKFGRIVAVLFMSFVALMPVSTGPLVEIRMYSWAALWVLLCFLKLYDVLQDNNKKDYYLLSLYALLGAYTHYIDLLCCFYFYIFLILFALFHRQYLKGTVLSCLMCVLLYLPWLHHLLYSFKVITNDWWVIVSPPFFVCIKYYFHCKKTAYFFWGSIFLLVSYFLSSIQISCRKIQFKWGVEKTWCLMGLLSAIFVIITGNLLSWYFRPVFISRYIYPTAYVVWLLFAVIIQRLLFKKILFGIVLISILTICGQEFYLNYQRIHKFLLSHTATISKVNPYIKEDTIFLTNNKHLEWTLLDYYYPNHKKILVKDKNIELQDRREYLFFLCYKKSEMLDITFNQRQIVDKGFLGCTNISVFYIKK